VLCPKLLFSPSLVYLLPEKEWLYLVPKESTPAQLARSNHRTRPPMLTDFHYDLLRTHPDCDMAKLEAAYKDWKKLHEYEYGAEIGADLLNTLALFPLAWNIFNEIKAIFTEEDQVVRATAKKKWIKKGVGEAVRDSNWEMFGTIQKGILDVAGLERHSRPESLNPFCMKGFWRRRNVLGKKLQSSKIIAMRGMIVCLAKHSINLYIRINHSILFYQLIAAISWICSFNWKTVIKLLIMISELADFWDHYSSGAAN